MTVKVLFSMVGYAILNLEASALCTVPQMITRPQMIPKMNRKWSSTASDTKNRPQMIPWKIEE